MRAQGTFLGLPYLDVNGNGVRDAREATALQKQNSGDADLSGLEMDFTWDAGRGVVLFANATKTRGNDQRLDEPLPRIPPLFGAAGARWQMGSGWRPWAELTYRFARPQRRLSPIDRSDTRVGPNGTDGFDVFDLRTGLSLGRHFRATAALENLFDAPLQVPRLGSVSAGLPGRLGAEFRFWRR